MMQKSEAFRASGAKITHRGLGNYMALRNYHSGICRKKLGTDFEWLGRSVSWKPLGGSPELHQLQNQKIWVRGSHRMAPMMTKFKAIRAQ